jgi:hypothetical protein
MATCNCETPSEFRATSEFVEDGEIYLRCGNCGEKAGTVNVDMSELRDVVTNPEEIDNTTVSQEGDSSPRVSIHFEAGDSPWTNK